MPFIIVVLTLLVALMVADADAETDAERLAEMFSPILILTEDTGHKWGEDIDRGIIVLKPEPVNIMGATSADSIWVVISDIGGYISASDRFGKLIESGVLDTSEVRSHQQGWNSDFLGNKWAFLTKSELKYLVSETSKGKLAQGVYALGIFLDYPGTTPKEWNDTYLGSGPYAGETSPNTAYVHIYKRKVPAYTDSVTVIQYKYFYPYNDWWNNHEGDWQGIDVVVSSSDPSTATILGVEYRFHGAWVNYYKDWGSKPGLTTNFVFDPRTEVKLSPGPTRDGLVQYTHPVVYVGAGSHAAYPTGGEIQIYYNFTGSNEDVPLSEDEVQGAVGGDFEHMTHTGLVLATQAPTSGSSLWEHYDLQLLPEPVLNNTNNMGLADTMSWLGARIQWGTPDVGGIGISESPYGPYNSNSEEWGVSKGWGELKFFKQGYTGIPPYPMDHRDLPYTSYHHWAVIGDETWSGTVSLYGDVVVFPGATLTIEAGPVVTFASQSDRHQILGGVSCLSEIFVYGTLTSNGSSDNRVVFRGPSDSTKPDDWGGIHTMTGGVVSLGNYTDVLNGTPVEYPGTLTLVPNPPQAFEEVTATLTDPNCIIEDSVQWTYIYLSSDEQGAAASSSPTGYTGTTSVKKKLGTPLPTDVGKRLKVTAHYRDGLGPGKSASIESAPVVSEDPPFVEGLLDLVVKEYIDPDIIGPVDVGTYTNADPNPNAPVWSLIGVDADEFNLVQKTSNAANERTLQFKQPPNYEVPLEGGGYKTTYDVGVKVTDTPVSGAVGTNGDALADTLLVTVTVINVEEGGSVTLAPLPPEVGTATVATLSDPDEGIVFTGARWTWQRRASETAAWEAVSAVGGTTDNYTELRSYTPVVGTYTVTGEPSPPPEITCCGPYKAISYEAARRQQP